MASPGVFFHLDLCLQVLLEKVHRRHGEVGVRLVQVVRGHRERSEDVGVSEYLLLGLLKGDGVNGASGTFGPKCQKRLVFIFLTEPHLAFCPQWPYPKGERERGLRESGECCA